MFIANLRYLTSIWVVVEWARRTLSVCSISLDLGGGWDDIVFYKSPLLNFAENFEIAFSFSWTIWLSISRNRRLFNVDMFHHSSLDCTTRIFCRSFHRRSIEVIFLWRNVKKNKVFDCWLKQSSFFRVKYVLFDIWLIRRAKRSFSIDKSTRFVRMWRNHSNDDETFFHGKEAKIWWNCFNYR